MQCLVEDQRIGVAAKRIKNLEKFKRHVLKGTDQIRKRGRPGVVFLELSMAWPHKSEKITSSLHSQLWPYQGTLDMKQFFDDNAIEIRSCVANSQVLAVAIVSFRIVTGRDQAWELAGHTMWYDTPANDIERRQYDMFFERFDKGIPYRAKLM